MSHQSSQPHGHRSAVRESDVDRRAAVDRWARSGCMSLTGPLDGLGLGPPARLVAGLDLVASRLAAVTARVGREVSIDPLQQLSERAAHTGATRAGQVSCGRASRLLRTADGWIALSLPRPGDAELVPAMIGDDVRADIWEAVTAFARRHSSEHLLALTRDLGLPIASLAEIKPPATHAEGAIDNALDALAESALLPANRTASISRGRHRSRDGPPLVIDLSSLWAGPLCGALLAQAGLRVVKVESATRPDGARLGPQDFYRRLNHAKRSVALHLPGDVGQLVALLRRADVVIEASRPRALARLGIDPTTLARTAPLVWVSITGHGYHDDNAMRVGFGDDAAVAGGLVAWQANQPMFCVDAVADPLTGMVGATLALEALSAGGSHHLDLAMSRVASLFAGPTIDVPAGTPAAPPRAHPPSPAAPSLGADNRRVAAELGLR